MTSPEPYPMTLADQYRAVYRQQFWKDVETGKKTPFFLHLCVLGAIVIPALYLAIPHRNRPWLYRARWLVVTVTTSFHIWMIRNVSSANFALGYGTGLVAAWGTVWNFTTLIWTKPQWDAQRVERFDVSISKGQSRAEKSIHSRRENKLVEHPEQSVAANDEALGAKSDAINGSIKPSRQKTSRKPTENGMRERHGANGNAAERPLVGDARRNGHAGIVEDDNYGPKSTTSRSSSGTQENQFVYKWQSYPDGAPFWTRLDWAFDISTTNRMTGWNWAIPILPPYNLPSGKTTQASLDSMSNTSRQGYSRCRNRKQLLLERLIFNIIPSYLILDLCATTMTRDPYFLLGPNDLPLPPHLASMNPYVLSMRRSLFGLVGIISALQLLWNVAAVAIAFCGARALGFRADVWHLASMSGSFKQVLDRGLAGFWGSWWHQTFRFGFQAPTRWMIARGYLERGSIATSVVGALVAFIQSGALHASGSYTTIATSRPWEPPIFFLLSGVGTQLQAVLSRKFKAQIEKMPRGVRRAGNLVFVAAWLYLTCWWLLDDFGRCGLWLWEPVPFSICRWLGFGEPGDYAWRWDRDSFPRWYTGKHWWVTGFGI